MWERPASDQLDPATIEFTMLVTSVEVPGSKTGAVDEEEHLAFGADPTLQARYGTATWPNGERAVRLGNAEEILITLATNPFAAMDVARSGALFGPAIPGLRIVVDSRHDGDFEVSWGAVLRAPIRWRKVSLRLYASPSLNVTVITIVPDKARTISSRSFVRVGLRVARELARRIEAQIDILSS